jgi:DNA invertase Pin-like site-specific DNA recombinase
MTTNGCHDIGMPTENDASGRQATFDRIRDVRAEAIKHTQLARRFAAERRDLMRGLIDEGVSQAEIARELGVSRQAIQKMLAC